MPFADDLKRLFGSTDLYAILGLDEASALRDISTACEKFARSVHPDRVDKSRKRLSTETFQMLTEVHKILSHQEMRRLDYETGGAVVAGRRIDILEDRNEPVNHWSSSSTVDLIKSFTDAYWGSEKEARDLRESYLKHKGDMGKIIEDIYCRPLVHEPRYRKLIQKWISQKILPNYHNFTKETQANQERRKRIYQKEANKALQNGWERRFNSDIDASECRARSSNSTGTAKKRRMKQDEWKSDAPPQKPKRGRGIKEVKFCDL